METKRCKICLRLAKSGDLCDSHKKVYIYDSKLDGYRLKKKKNGTSTRYIPKKYHSHEISLTRLVEHFYGPNEVITGFHPLWAVSKKGALLEFDICIPSKKVLIEYNGIQHYEFTACFHKNKTKFLEQQRRDRKKQKLAKKNNYKLIIFKYDEPLFEDYVINKIQGVINGNKN